ncbi:MAG: hypothetical protein D6767_05085 [Candidatus Hydrogenedentota bacterium]|nr:MAG: hypothetical protein D6767_05085 [Candidatus Hydrogenedentota bacterium]
MNLTQEQIAEVQKMLKLKKMYEGILRTSRNPEQIQRARIDLKKVLDRIDMLCPDGVPPEIENPNLASQNTPQKQYEILDQFEVTKASPHCEDENINIANTVIHVWEEEFMPALSESKVKLDYSNSTERDSHYALLENLKRQLKILTDAIEDYANTEREDLKLQLRDIRDRHMRHFLHETGVFLKKVHDFWKKILEDIRSGGMACMNQDEIIHMKGQFDAKSFLDGVVVSKAIETAVKFLDEAIDALNLPDLPKG